MKSKRLADPRQGARLHPLHPQILEDWKRMRRAAAKKGWRRRRAALSPPGEGEPREQTHLRSSVPLRGRRLQRRATVLDWPGLQPAARSRGSIRQRRRGPALARGAAASQGMAAHRRSRERFGGAGRPGGRIVAMNIDDASNSTVLRIEPRPEPCGMVILRISIEPGANQSLIVRVLDDAQASAIESARRVGLAQVLNLIGAADELLAGGCDPSALERLRSAATDLRNYMPALRGELIGQIGQDFFTTRRSAMQTARGGPHEPGHDRRSGIEVASRRGAPSLGLFSGRVRRIGAENVRRAADGRSDGRAASAPPAVPAGLSQGDEGCAFGCCRRRSSSGIACGISWLDQAKPPASCSARRSARRWRVIWRKKG